MRKIIASGFILILLLLSLWGISAWFMGARIAANVDTFIQNSVAQSESSFVYELMDYKRSLFDAEARIKIFINRDTLLTNFIKDEFNDEQELILNFTILHGPLLFNTEGITLGSSVWKFEPSKHAVSSEKLGFLSKSISNTQSKASMSFSFDNTVGYQATLNDHLSQLIINGIYDLDTNTHQGKLKGSSLNIKGGQWRLQAQQAELNYQQLATSSVKNIKYELMAKSLFVTLEHQLLSKKVNFATDLATTISIDSNTLNSNNKFVFDFKQNQSDWRLPTEKVDLIVNTSDIDLLKISNLFTTLNEYYNLQDQSDWLITEQGAFPEGQDHLWQLHDDLVKEYQKLPNLVSEILINNHNKQDNNLKTLENDLNVKFQVVSQSDSKKSTVIGILLPDVLAKKRNNPENFNGQISSFLQAKAKVSLDDAWLAFLSERLPIKTSHFNLTYKQNKLLMQ